MSHMRSWLEFSVVILSNPLVDSLGALMKSYFAGLLLFISFVCDNAQAQNIPLPATARADSATLQNYLPALAKQVISNYQNEDENQYLSALFRLQSVANEHQNAEQTLSRIMQKRRAVEIDSELPLMPFWLYEQAAHKRSLDNTKIGIAFQASFQDQFKRLNNLQANQAIFWFQANVERARLDLDAELIKHLGQSQISLIDAIALLRKSHFYKSYRVIAKHSNKLIEQDDARRYVIEQNLLIDSDDGAKIAAILIRPRSIEEKRPSLLVFTIYADLAGSFSEARTMAAHGYAGLIAFTRGKAHSPSEIVPYEHDGDDARSVIDWITKQSWSDGRIGMYGGSYNGFTQWAAAKKLPKALKTIVPYVANNPGDGLPMENNIFLLVNYAWPFYTTNNKFLDNETYFDSDRWNALNEKWYLSGQSYRQVDVVDGRPNPWLQRWLDHPSYDAYWQNMVPHRRDYSRIDIPVLSITGYYDAGQHSALRYLNEHYRFNSNAKHYLLIGPYDHGGAQATRKPDILNGYAIDPVAKIDTPKITFEWMDHVFHGAPLPSLLKDKVNYQVMGADTWKHAPTIKKMNNHNLKLFLSNQTNDGRYKLTERKQKKRGTLSQIVDFGDRKTSLNDYYPNPIIGKVLDESYGLVFASEPFQKSFELSGVFSGEFNLTINKRDLDFGVTLYEQLPTGELFQLSYYLGRASYAENNEKRKLLRPGKKTKIVFNQTRLVSRLISQGSRLLITLSVNKNAYAQVNHGTGKNVSDENQSDAGDPLVVEYHNDSFLLIPVWQPLQ